VAKRSFVGRSEVPGSGAAQRENDRLRPLAQANFREKARDMIRAGIVSGQIEAGRLYSIAYFQSRLLVSATPIREALFDLANEGLIEVVRNKGFRVPELSEDELNEIFELRELLEVHATSQLVGKITDLEIAECQALAEETMAWARASDLQGFLSSDRQFHRCLLAATRNRRLADIVGRLRDATRLRRLPEVTESGELVLSAEEHLEIVKALKAGDAAEVTAWIKHHLGHTRGIWLRRQSG
jgi:DNA-binding GntR family transcriptional regulator